MTPSSASGSSPAGRRSRLPVVDETSAGGIVVIPGRRGAEIALIARRNRRGRLEWVLPKGHVEPGESPEDAAVREVREETGLESRVVAPLGSIRYWFVADGRRVHKTVHHFLLEGVGGTLSDEDVEVEQVEQLPLDEALERLAFADEKALLSKAAAMLAGPGS